MRPFRIARYGSVAADLRCRRDVRFALKATLSLRRYVAAARWFVSYVASQPKNDAEDRIGRRHDQPRYQVEINAEPCAKQWQNDD